MNFSKIFLAHYIGNYVSFNINLNSVSQMINITEKYHSEKLKKLPNMRDYGVNPLKEIPKQFFKAKKYILF